MGGYVLELLDDAGAVLRSVSFAAQTVVAGVSETGESVPALELPPRPRSMAGHNPSRSKRPPVTARSAHWTARPCRGQAASTVRWGTGAHLVIVTGDLTAGTHTHTVTATNPQGTSAPSATVTATALASAAPSSSPSSPFDDVTSTHAHAPAITALVVATATTSTKTTAFGRYGIFDRTLCGDRLFCPASREVC